MNESHSNADKKKSRGKTFVFRTEMAPDDGKSLNLSKIDDIHEYETNFTRNVTIVFQCE